MRGWAADATAHSERFYAAPPGRDFRFDGRHVRFPSASRTPHPDNDTVHARYFPASFRSGETRRAVVVLPHWNADPGSHVALAGLLARFGISAVRLSLPYHDARMPPELHRADYIVSANVGRTAQVCRQAVLDTRRAVDWLESRGYERIGVLGTSLGSCLAMLAAAHDARISAAALNHISPYFADVVWEGLSTAHVRAGLEGSIDLEVLRDVWLPISPAPFLDRMRGTRTLLVYARYDLSFPVRLSRQLVAGFRRQRAGPGGIRAALRALQHRGGAVQLAGRIRAHPFPAAGSAAAPPLIPHGRSDVQVAQQVPDGLVEQRGELADQRLHVPFVHGIGYRHRLREQQPDRGRGEYRGQQAGDADQAHAQAGQ